ncbi:MAG: FG-GAP and VCBS repeat-containing protein, partial [Salibacteraceae bacterium]
MKTPMQKLGIALALSLSPSLVTQAQFNLGFELYNDIKVVQNNDTLAHPWVGGLNNPQFSSIDIDLDGHHDIVAYERDGEVYRVFIWEEGVSYRSDFTSHKALPKVRGSFALFRDYNEDGKQDLFSVGYNNQGINVHLNTSESEVSFTQMTENLRFRHPGSGYLYSYFPANDLPGIADFNGDGDLDIIVQGQTGVLDYPALLYFENQSQELYGHSDSLAYELVNPCWGKIREFVNDAGWTEYICDTNRSGNRGSRHGGTTLTPIDLNGDGAMDLLTGDAYSGNMQSLINTSTSVDAVVDLSLSDSTYPSYDDPIFVPTLPAAFFEDIDHDGEKDLIAAPNQLTAIATFYLDTSINTNVDWYYKNVGTTAHPDFKLQEKGFFSGKMIDVGSKSMPALADINGDGLLDLLVGNEGFTAYGGSAAASLTLYLNVGDIENPVFELVDKDFLDISEFGFGFVHPALADLDGDGDYDLLIGEDQGMLHYFKNRGTPEIHDFHLTEPEFANIDVDLSAHPQFFDVNLDGAPDLLVGDYYGRIQYFENAGTPSEPDFSKNPTVEKVGDLLTFHAHGGESTPMLTRKLDSLGSNLYLLQSNADGVIL